MADASTRHPHDATPHCPTCAYDLRAHVSDDGASCPECGRALALGDIVWRVPKQPPAGLPVLQWSLVSAAFTVVAFVIVTPQTIAAVLNLYMATWLSVCIIGGWFIARRVQDHVSIVYRFTSALAFAVILFFSGGVVGIFAFAIGQWLMGLAFRWM